MLGSWLNKTQVIREVGARYAHVTPRDVQGELVNFDRLNRDGCSGSNYGS